MTLEWRVVVSFTSDNAKDQKLTNYGAPRYESARDAMGDARRLVRQFPPRAGARARVQQREVGPWGPLSKTTI